MGERITRSKRDQHLERRLTHSDIFGPSLEEERARTRMREDPRLLETIASGAEHQEQATQEEESELAGLAKAGEAGVRIGDAHRVTSLGSAEHEAKIPWIKAALVPEIVDLLKHDKVVEAAEKMARLFTFEELCEGLMYAAKKFHLSGAERGLERWVVRAIAATAAMDIYWWTYDGLREIAKAHAQGDRDARIRMYSSAFAAGFLFGESAHAEVSPVTLEEREAVRTGVHDGARTAASLGELAPIAGRELLRRYGDERGVKHAVVDELLRRAGLSGIYGGP